MIKKVEPPFHLRLVSFRYMVSKMCGTGVMSFMSRSFTIETMTILTLFLAGPYILTVPVPVPEPVVVVVPVSSMRGFATTVRHVCVECVHTTSFTWFTWRTVVYLVRRCWSQLASLPGKGLC